MKSKRIPSYLFKSPHGIYCFRVRIPSPVRIKYNTSKIEIRRSLNAGDAYFRDYDKETTSNPAGVFNLYKHRSQFLLITDCF